jgi:enoyl-CoA hydratase/carnithine racemase
MTIFHYAVDADGVAVLTWDLPGKSMNVLNEDGIAELGAGIDRALADGIDPVLVAIHSFTPRLRGREPRPAPAG